MSSDCEFTEDEIRNKLLELGYTDIPREKLREFAGDLRQLMQFEKTSHPDQRRPVRQEPSFSSSTNTTDFTASYSSTTDDQTSTDTPGERIYASRGLLERDHLTTQAQRTIGKSMLPSKAMYVQYGKENQLVPIQEATSPTSDTTSIEYERPGSKIAKKRKVLRKRNGEARVFDESFTSNDSGSSATDISELEQRLRDLPLRRDPRYDDVFQEPLDYRPWERQQAEGALPSYIRPNTSHPHTRGIRKCDPVNRYHQFRNEWEHKKAPGEKNRNSLRWNVRGQMLQCDVFERPQRNYVPNNYVVPTQKKRQSLRWQVRTSLARA